MVSGAGGKLAEGIVLRLHDHVDAAPLFFLAAQMELHDLRFWLINLLSLLFLFRIGGMLPLRNAGRHSSARLSPALYLEALSLLQLLVGQAGSYLTLAGFGG